LVRVLVSMHPLAYTLAALGATAFVSAIVAAAVVIGNVTDTVIVPVLDDGVDHSDILRPGLLAVIGVATWKAIGIVLRRAAAGWLQYRTQADVREQLIDRMLRLELSWHNQRGVGDLLAVTDTDAHQATFILAPLPYATGASLLLIGSVVMVAIIDPVMAVFAAIALVTVASVDIGGAFRMFNAFEEVQHRRGAVAQVAHESFDGALTVKSLGRAGYETTRFERASNSLRDQVATVESRLNLYRVAVEGLLSAMALLAIIIGAARIQAGAITAGDMISIAYLFSLLFIPIRIVGFVIWDMAHSTAAWERVDAVLSADHLVDYGALAHRPDETGAEVASSDVFFQYGEEPILHDIEVTIPEGRTIAVVGPTASGKSTLVTLLARLWDPTSGAIRLDGRDLRDFARSALAGEVAFVPQEAFLFSDTALTNIGFGSNATQEEVLTAAKIAAAHEFITQLPHGYNTMVGERGATLSGGQRQRIALARALVRRPRLLILDDATSAVDPSVETRILETLKTADLPSTIVIVAYRRSSIMLAEEVLFIDEGRVVAHGTHQELMEIPAYSSLLLAYEHDREGGTE
jgi:ABC-type multidrug transport system fused ATPase/permease subunit